VLDTLYGGIAAARRSWYSRPGASRVRLAAPVISVGNLSVGGTGKTPVVAALAAWLVAEGERPAILSRGYARRRAPSGATVVSDGVTVRAGVDLAGDEPLMLARQVPGACVVVAADRATAGRAAERELGATVHLLDDGFQHLHLARDLDIVVTAPGEIAGGRVLPMGRLREPASALRAADLLVVVGASVDEADAEARALRVKAACGATRHLGPPVAVPTRGPADAAGRVREAPTRDRPVIAVAGIGRPEGFFDALRAEGWTLAATLAFPDHHRFGPADLAAVDAAARAKGAWAILTTDKDAVRLEGTAALPVPLWRVPLTLEVRPWERLSAAVRAAMARRRAEVAR
jgi:tetraacyldisaccharide 4'-kinase